MIFFEVSPQLYVSLGELLYVLRFLLPHMLGRGALEPLQQGLGEIITLLLLYASDHQCIPVGLERPNTLKGTVPLEGSSQIGAEAIASTQQILGSRVVEGVFPHP